MSEYQLLDRYYVLPTPAGAFYASSTQSRDSAKQLLFSLMSLKQSQLLSVPQACKWTGIKSQEDVLELLYRVQSLGWIQGEIDPRPAPSGALEEILPALVASLSSSSKALLADDHGFYLTRQGFSHETAEELSALSADLLALHKRHTGLLNKNIGLHSEAWSVVDATGNGQLGFWPLYVGKQQFVLILSGLPQLNQLAFVQLIWVLNKRYNAISHTNLSTMRTEVG
ncbi:hypothetical protein MNBD_GAMMA25-475 [hydrothermal vent metagenome]|uniref:Roadblock/LAMTOR2 domain-containing protein n=1 Tax=hydrothermal vent metagenome TaxID=652676 RepID=A0A3B1AQF9_9ZZZZ